MMPESVDADPRSDAANSPVGLLHVGLFGPPGSGKGTQASRLAQRFNLAHLSTGDLLRAEIQAGTELGRRVADLLHRGVLVPDEWVSDVVRAEVERNARLGRGVLYDGYPRTRRQLELLEAILRDAGAKLALGLMLELPPEALVKRLTARRVCRQCQRVYNLETHPPATVGRCDACGGELFQREDDAPDVIRRRLQEYERQTAPLLAELDRRGLLRRIDADRPVEELQAELVRLINDRTA